MKIERTAANLFLIFASEDEMVVLNNCMNEACNGIHIEEFKTRVGVSKEEARELLAIVRAAFGAEMPPTQ